MRTYENKDELKNEINKVKIIFFDIDGTLLEMGKTEITPNMRKALCSLKQNGIKICIATGRPFVTIPMFEGIVFDAILAFNGSFCVAGDQVVAKCPIPKEDVKKIIENAGVDINKYTDDYRNYNQFKNKIEEIRIDKEKKDYKDKKMVVFMPFKAKYWNMMAGLWKEYERSGEYTLIAIPAPYYYKNIDGTVEKFNDDKQYPEYVKIVSPENFDFDNEYVEKIIIQNPYDSYNATTTVHPQFYAKKLAMCTKELIYIPYFETEEINPSDMRAYVSMDSYVTMPGVVYSDKVIVQSEGIKALYVKKLSEYFGEETRDIWNTKIIGNGKHYIEMENSDSKYDDIPEKWKGYIKKSDGSYKKVILYFICTNDVLENGHRVFDKIKRSMDTFLEYEDSVVPLMMFESNIDEILQMDNPELLEDYNEIKMNFTQYIVNENELDKAMNLCDAFYGDAGSEAQLCRNSGKPVMIQNVEI